MEVTDVHFEAFKSLYNVSCDLEHFTVITGPNGSGKSNFVEALHFLGEVYAHGLEFAVSRAGGYDNIAHRRTRRAKHPITVEVVVKVDSTDLRGEVGRLIGLGRTKTRVPKGFQLNYSHRFSLRTATQSLLSDFAVRDDRVAVNDGDGRLLLELERGPHGDVKVSPGESDDDFLQELIWPFFRADSVGALGDRPLLPTNLLTDQMYFPNILFAVRRALGRTRVFQLSPYQCRSAGVSTPNASLERYGENLPGAADHLRRNDESAWALVQSAMRSIMPKLVGIEVTYTEDRRLALQFRERGMGRPWNANEVSDGTIQAFAMFLALYDPRTPLLVIEEPENSVHPWVLRQFLDYAREAVGKQIVLTTHSPVLLNYVEPRTVRLMSMRSGRSTIERLIDASPEIKDLILSGELSLFDVYDSGAMPKGVPKGFTPHDVEIE